MKKLLPFVLVLCLGLFGCGGKKLVEASSFWNKEAIVGEGYVLGFGPLDEKEEVKLRVENEGKEKAELALYYEDSQKGEVVYQSFSLAPKEKKTLDLKRIKDTQGKPQGYTLKVTSDNDSRIFAYGTSYLPEGTAYETPSLNYDKTLADEAETTSITGQGSEVRLPFTLEAKVSHFHLGYESQTDSKLALSLYRKKDNVEVFSTEGKGSLSLNQENTFALEGQAEAFELVIKDSEGAPLEGNLTTRLYFKTS